MGASTRGYHFISEYRNCPRKWYLHYLMNLEPTDKKEALRVGTAWHSGKEAWYKGAEMREAQVAIRRSIFEGADPLDSELDLAARKLAEMFETWLEDFGFDDRKNLEVLSVEQEMTIKLIGDIVMYAKPDLIAFDKRTEQLLIFDTKYTGFSKQAPLDTLLCNDQATAYTCAVFDNYEPKMLAKFGGLVPDITYSKGKVIEHLRPSVITRSTQDMERFRRNALGAFIEIDQKMAALDDGIHPDVLFPRCGEWCATFKCPYSGLCRGNISSGDVYQGFAKTAPQEWRVDSPWRRDLSELRGARPLIYRRPSK